MSGRRSDLCPLVTPSPPHMLAPFHPPHHHAQTPLPPKMDDLPCEATVHKHNPPLRPKRTRHPSGRSLEAWRRAIRASLVAPYAIATRRTRICIATPRARAIFSESHALTSRARWSVPTSNAVGSSLAFLMSCLISRALHTTGRAPGCIGALVALTSSLRGACTAQWRAYTR